MIACSGSSATSEDQAQQPAPSEGSNAAPSEGSAPATQDTAVSFNLSGLSAWSDGDSLQLVSRHRGVVLSAIEGQLAAPPPRGATTVAGSELNWKHTSAPLLDAASGDPLLLTQQVAATSNGRVYTALARAGAVAGLTLRDGRSASLATSLVPLERAALVLRWRGAAFAALTAEAGPDAEPAGAATVAISARPEGREGPDGSDLAAEIYAGLPALVTFAPLPGVDLDQEVAYANPFPQLGGTWSELATVVYSASVPVPTQWGVGAVPARMVAALPVAALRASGELAPQLSPVREVAREGRALSWKAPALGVPTGYSIEVSAVSGDAQGVRIAPAARLATKGTAIELPALAAGTYVVTITALSSGKGGAFAAADHVTAQFAL